MTEKIDCSDRKKKKEKMNCSDRKKWTVVTEKRTVLTEILCDCVTKKWSRKYVTEKWTVLTGKYGNTYVTEKWTVRTEKNGNV